MISIQTNAAEFNRTLAEYVALRKRDLHTEVVRKGRDISLRLAGYNDTGGKFGGQEKGLKLRSGGFGPPVQSTPERIQAGADKLGGRPAGRKTNALTKATKWGVSEAAAKLAVDMMEGQKMQAFKDSQFGLYPVRFAKSKKKPRILHAGRYGGEKWRTRGRGLHTLNDDELERASQINGDTSGYKLLNVVAVAKGLELRLRKRAAIGGLLSVQWIPKAWRKRRILNKENFPRNASFVAIGEGGKAIGRVDVVNEGVNLSGLVPGTKKFPGAIADALRRGAEDMRGYIREKMLGQFRATVLKQLT